MEKTDVAIYKISPTFVVSPSACRYCERSLSVLCRSNRAQDPLPVQELPAAHWRLPSSAGHHVPAQIQVCLGERVSEWARDRGSEWENFLHKMLEALDFYWFVDHFSSWRSCCCYLFPTLMTLGIKCALCYGSLGENSYKILLTFLWSLIVIMKPDYIFQCSVLFRFLVQVQIVMI